METENVNCSFSCPPRADIQISGLLGLGPQCRFSGTKVSIAFLETSTEGGCLVKRFGG